MPEKELRIHAICLALNEERFITETINSLYPFCSGISIITQYDRDYYGKIVIPDSTVSKVLAYPDPQGKIHLVSRKYKDETAARNHEMLALTSNPTKGIMSHGVAMDDIQQFHRTPDYFLIVDADEIYDVATFGNIIRYLSCKNPKGMRVTGYQYLWTWNQRIPTNVIHHHHFGFVKPGTLFEMRRTVSWNEFRLQKLFRTLRLPDVASKLYGFIECPEEVGVFHHGSYLGGQERLVEKFAKHSHPDVNNPAYISKIGDLSFNYIPTVALPENIRKGVWPANFFDDLTP